MVPASDAAKAPLIHILTRNGGSPRDSLNDGHALKLAQREA